MAEEPKQEGRKVRAIVLWAASYTGATWISHVLSAWPGVFSLGNPKTVLQRLSNEPERMCAVHRDKCTFWPAFAKQWKPRKNLLIQLAQYTGDSHFIINNPRSKQGWSVLDDQKIQINQFAIQRDLRALAASYMRKNSGVDIVQTLEDWLLTAANTMFTDVNRSEVHLIEYEKVSSQHTLLLEILSQATGFHYKPEHLRFWEHDSHVVTANSGTIGTISAYQNMNSSHQQEFYNDFLKKIRRGEALTFRDERWRRELGRFDLYVIDQCLGSKLADMGYERDKFTSNEMRVFSEKLSGRLQEGTFHRVRKHLSSRVRTTKIVNSIKHIVGRIFA